MNRQMFRLLLVMAMALVVSSTLVISACAGRPGPTPAPPPSPGGDAVVLSDSIISGEIKAIRKQTTGYPWEMDILVQSSDNVDSLPNPTKDVGQVITTKTDEDLSSFKVNQMITARVKYVGDVPRPGISLYIYDIKIK